MRGIIGLVAVAVMVTACSSEKTADAAKESTKRQAGSWKNTLTLDQFEVAGAPPELKTMMQGMMTAASKEEVCMTPEFAAKENLAESLAKSQASQNCTFSKQELVGGKLDVAAICKDNNGQSLNLKMAGTSSATTTNVKTELTGKAPTGGDMKMVITIVSERTGDCKPGQKMMVGGQTS